jgi:biopolymer transport protein ExbD
MSHGVSSSGISAEPNLIPLLDLVFQLIMFFMICVNFVSEQVNEEIKLPVAQSARAMDKGEVEVLVLNMKENGDVRVVGQQKPLHSQGEKLFFLRNYYADTQRSAELRGEPKGAVKTTVIIRADKNASYSYVYELLNMCKQANFKKLQLRAYVSGG